MHLIIFTLNYLEHQVISSQDINLGARRTKLFRRARLAIAASNRARHQSLTFIAKQAGHTLIVR